MLETIKEKHYLSVYLKRVIETSYQLLACHYMLQQNCSDLWSMRKETIISGHQLKNLNNCKSYPYEVVSVDASICKILVTP